MASILIVEDEPLIALMLEDWVAELGHQTIGPAATVPEALHFVDTSPIHAAILDVRLRESRCDAIAEILVTRNVPFVFASGDASDLVSGKFADRPKISKPYEFQTVKDCLGQLLESACV